MNDALRIAQELLLPNGIAPLPIWQNSKRAALKWGKWQAEGIPQEQLPLLFEHDNLTVAAICGAASRNLVVFDCDSPAAFEHYRAALGDPQTWIVQSKRGGHIWFRSPVPVKSVKRDAEMQILAQGTYVLAPGARHPSGITYQFLRSTARILELPSLAPLPGIELEPLRVRPTGMPRLAWRLLNGLSVRREYHSDSEREFAAICAMVNSGMTFPRILNAFVRLANKSSHFGRWMTERGRKSAESMLERMYRKALAFTANDSAERRLAKATRAWLLDHPLTGRTGVYDHLIFDHVLQISLRAGSLSVAVGARDLGEEVGLSKDAASKGLKRLRERGWLELESEWSGPFSNIYRVKPPETILQNLYTSTQEINVRKCIGFENRESIFSHDAFRWGALSKSIAQVWDCLARTSCTQKELCARTGRSQATISRALDALQELHLIEPSELRGWEIVWQLKATADLNEIARFYETAGKRAAQQRKHSEQRAQYLKQLQTSNSADLLNAEEISN